MENENATKLNLQGWGELQYGTAFKVFLTVLYSLILLFGIVGNLVTINVTQVLLRNGYLQKNVTDHMVSLACSDLLVLLIGMPVELYNSTWFPFSSGSGNTSCKIYNFLFEACSYATILNVATLSFERYMVICHPLKYHALSGSRTVKLIVFAWVTSVLVALPLLYATGTESHQGILELNNRSSSLMQNLTFCTNLTSMWTMYRSSIFVAFVVYIVVLASVGFMCNSMIHVLTATARKSANSDANSVESLPKHESSQVKESRKQSIVFLGLIVGALAGCWMPNQIRRLMTAAKPRANWTAPYMQSYVLLHPFADSFFYLSSVLNPILYNFSSRQFRQVFLQVLRCRLTIEHVNRRNLRRPMASSARQLLLRTLRRGRSAHTKGKPSPLATSQTPGGAPPDPQCAVCPSQPPELNAAQHTDVIVEGKV